ncbi:hypothetical protein L7F22_030751, partial [Adiantum nelumboides]|nr:hypothetical protein [Adiantum nelumboides]
MRLQGAVACCHYGLTASVVLLQPRAATRRQQDACDLDSRLGKRVGTYILALEKLKKPLVHENGHGNLSSVTLTPSGTAPALLGLAAPTQ